MSLPLGSGMKEKWILDFPFWISLTSSEFKKYPEACLTQPHPRIPEGQSRNSTTTTTTTSSSKNNKPRSLDTDWTEEASPSGKGVRIALARLGPVSVTWGNSAD